MPHAGQAPGAPAVGLNAQTSTAPGRRSPRGRHFPRALSLLTMVGPGVSKPALLGRPRQRARALVKRALSRAFLTCRGVRLPITACPSASQQDRLGAGPGAGWVLRHPAREPAAKAPERAGQSLGPGQGGLGMVPPLRAVRAAVTGRAGPASPRKACPEESWTQQPQSQAAGIRRALWLRPGPGPLAHLRLQEPAAASWQTGVGRRWVRVHTDGSAVWVGKEIRAPFTHRFSRSPCPFL